ncbi:MAG TPA: glycoside hydrolase family 19 protein [Puia sp.]|jgi:putative chitinase|nr:glycoside hydrolase family 19 protein [Puia sp.]
MTIDQSILQAIVPGITPGNLALYLPFLQQLLPHYHIDTPQRIGGFLAQVAEESINFSHVKELATGAEYEGRSDLGNIHPGDGVKYKGRGLIQITGRGNYQWCSKDIFADDRLLVNPDLLLQPEYAIQSACWFWTTAKPLNAVCDHPEDWTTVWHHNGKTYTKIQWMTLLVNGGQNGIDVRTANYERARKVLNF